MSILGSWGGGGLLRRAVQERFAMAAETQMVEIESINRLVMNRVAYEFHHGPAIA